MTTTTTTTTTAAEVVRFVVRKVIAAQATVEAARAGLVEQAARVDVEAGTLVTQVHLVVEAEAAHRFWARIERSAALALDEDGTVEALVARLREVQFDLISGGADDAWSGRGNDAQRVAFDARLRAARALSYEIG